MLTQYRFFPAIPLFLALVGSSRAPELRPAPAVIHPGAYRMDEYLPLLRGKSVALFANQTATIGSTHLVDTLLKLGIHVTVIFSPEHGFRGTADAGEQVSSSIDSLTGLRVISLYGKHVRPSAEDLAKVDVLLFDIQDVGVRFYTYLSSLQEYLQSAIDNRKPLILLDRPNPNGFYVDGPLLDTHFRSFVGKEPVPVVYGMTLGEYAKMLLGEGWVTGAGNAPGFSLTVIPCEGYTHKSHYRLPVKPSPNLPDMQSVYLYPSLCYFEGTAISLGRGTDKPFQCFGSPRFPSTGYQFTPRSVPGAKNPPLLGQTCNGFDLVAPSDDALLKQLGGRIQLKWLLEAYRLFPVKDSFFLKTGGFNRLAGSAQLMQQMKEGLSEAAIRESWQPGIKAFLKIRAKYLMYP